VKQPLLIPLGLYVAACCLPALEWRTDKGVTDVMFGLRALAVGWSGIFALVLGWYANPFWGLGMLLGAAGKRSGASVCAVIAFAIGLTIYVDTLRSLPADTGGNNRTRIVAILPGAQLWLLSIAALPVVMLTRRDGATSR